jgi:PAS domain S-box-containing protein
MTTKPTSVMIVEDEALIAADLEHRLMELKYEVTAVVDSASAAWRAIEARRPDVILMDIRIHGPVDGIELAQQVRERQNIPVVFLTAHADSATLQRAKLTQPYGYLIKPVGAGALPGAIETTLYRHRAEQELRRRKSWLETTLRSIGDAILVTDREQRVCYANAEATALLGMEESACVDHPLDQVLALRHDAGGQVVPSLLPVAELEGTTVQFPPHVHIENREGQLVQVEGAVTPCLLEGERYGAVVVFRDITARLAREREARREEKILTVGRMAGGLTRDIGTWLQNIRQTTRQMDTVGPEAAPAAAGLREVVQNGEALMRQLRALTLRRGLPQEPVNVGEVLAAHVEDLDSEIPPGVELTTHFEDRGQMVRANSQYLVRILHNLVRYAANSAGSGGKVEVSASMVTRDEASGPLWGDFVRISVHDNGPGISPEDLEYVFDPFFEVRSGTRNPRFDLAAVQQIASLLGGAVAVHSEEGQGASFDVYLPVSAAAWSGPADGDSAAQPWPTLLLVEPQETVRQTLHNHLESHHYNLIEASQGGEALDLVAVYEGPLDLVVTRLELPDLSGVELIHRLREQRPGLRALLICENDGNQVDLAGVETYTAPLRKAELLERVERLLRPAAEAAAAGASNPTCD